MTRLIISLAVELVALGFLQRELGLDTLHLVLLTTGLVVLTVVALAPRTTGPTAPTPHPRWPRDRRDRRAGSRDEVASLAWTFFGRDNTVSARALRTVRTIAATRLRAHGADLFDPDDAPACRALLGHDAHRLLDPTLPSNAPRPSATELDRIITALEKLPPPHATPQRTRTTP